VFDFRESKITRTHRFEEGGHIYEILELDEPHYLLPGKTGLLRTTKD
jgi:hypothetical protein